MPSTHSTFRVLALVVLVCVGSSGAVAASAPVPESAGATAGCFPTADSVERGEAVGDVVEIEMLLCFSGTVTVEGPGYRGNATLGDGNRSGHVTLRLNTRANGSAVFGVRSDVLDSVPLNATGEGSFRPGTYTVTIRDWSGDVTETVQFELTEPRAQDLTLWRAPVGAAARLETVERVRASRAAAATLDSQRQTGDPGYDDYLSVATNETLVVAIRAQGVDGAMAAGEGTPIARFRTALRETNATFAVEQTEETTTPERQRLVLDLLNESASHLVAHPANDTYYLVVDTRRLWADKSESYREHVGSHPGLGFVLRLSMRNASAETGTPPDRVAADFRMVEPAADVPYANGDAVPLEATSDARLPVWTTLAPGTAVTARLSGGVNRTITRTVRARDTRYPGFVLPVDLSGVPNGTTFTVRFERDGRPLETDTVDVVVRSTGPELDTRSGSVVVYRARNRTFDTAGDVADAFENRTLDRAENVVVGDTLVVPLESAALARAMGARNGSATSRFFDVVDSDAAFRIVQTNPTPQRNPKVAVLGPENVTVHRAGTTAYVLVETQNLSFRYRGVRREAEIHGGERFAVQFGTDRAELPAPEDAPSAAVFETYQFTSRFGTTKGWHEPLAPEWVSVPVAVEIPPEQSLAVRLTLGGDEVKKATVRPGESPTLERVWFDLRNVSSGTEYELELVRDGAVTDRHSGTLREPRAQVANATLTETTTEQVVTEDGERVTERIADHVAVDVTVSLSHGGKVQVFDERCEQVGYAWVDPGDETDLTIPLWDGGTPIRGLDESDVGVFVRAIRQKGDGEVRYRGESATASASFDGECSVPALSSPSTPTDTPEPTPTPAGTPPTATTQSTQSPPTSDGSDATQTTPSASDRRSERATDAFAGSGFTVATVVVALLGLALVGVRRD